MGERVGVAAGAPEPPTAGTSLDGGAGAASGVGADISWEHILGDVQHDEAQHDEAQHADASFFGHFDVVSPSPFSPPTPPPRPPRCSSASAAAASAPPTAPAAPPSPSLPP